MASQLMKPFGEALDVPATQDEIRSFAALQSNFSRSFQQIFDDLDAPRTIVIIPSLSLDQEIMTRVTGVSHYEERMLCFLLLLRLPRTRVVHVTSMPIHESIIDYYLHLLPGIPSRHARRRLTLLSCDNDSPVALTRKILTKPNMLQELKNAIDDVNSAHMTCFTVTELERRLAIALDIPIYGCDPSLLHLGSKSGSRKIFREAEIALPMGFEDLNYSDDIARALAELKAMKPGLCKAVVKMNEGFSGEGNAVFDLTDAPKGARAAAWCKARLPNMAFQASAMSWEIYSAKFESMGGIVEEFIEGKVKESPSVQFRINPIGQPEAISTHDQVLVGQSGQIFSGCRFPAKQDYRMEIQDYGARAAEVLSKKGVLGRFGVDFISVKDSGTWQHVAIEINLRKGGTTPPFLMLQFLTDGRYSPDTGEFLTPSGRPRSYYASDNLESDTYLGLTPDDLIDIAVMNHLYYHSEKSEGVAFHLIGALEKFGKLGVVCIGRDQAHADALYERTVAVLNRECPKPAI